MIIQVGIIECSSLLCLDKNDLDNNITSNDGNSNTFYVHCWFFILRVIIDKRLVSIRHTWFLPGHQS